MQEDIHQSDIEDIPLICLILWTDEILHHQRNSGMMIPQQLPTNNEFPPSTVWYLFRDPIRFGGVEALAAFWAVGTFHSQASSPRTSLAEARPEDRNDGSGGIGVIYP